MYYNALANDYHQEFLSQQAFNTLAKRAHFLQVSVQQILQKRYSSMQYKQNGSVLLKVFFYILRGGIWDMIATVATLVYLIYTQ